MEKINFEKNLKPRFIWDKEENINNLIQYMLSYKSEMEFEGKDTFLQVVEFTKTLAPWTNPRHLHPTSLNRPWLSQTAWTFNEKNDL